MTRILIAEDEPRISSFIDKGLRAAGYTTEIVTDGRAALTRAATGDVDLVILDIGLPGMDGFRVLDALRGSGNDVPVVVLTARDSVQDTVTGLRLGADDYMRKPFDFDELLARIRTRLRPPTRTQGESTTLSVGAITVDMLSRRVTVAGVDVDLSAREFALAEELLRHPGRVWSREQLLSSVWGYDYDPGSNVVDVYIRYLRRKLGPHRIETVRGVGYRLVAVD